MKKLITALVLLALVLLVGCKSEEEKTAEGWAVKAACEYYQSEYNGDAIITVDDIDYYYVDGNITSKVFRNDEEDWVGKAFKITFENPDYQSDNTAFYVAVLWHYEISLLELESGKNASTITFAESAIVDVDISEAEND